jgi:hypothetical protein
MPRIYWLPAQEIWNRWDTKMVLFTWMPATKHFQRAASLCTPTHTHHMLNSFRSQSSSRMRRP